MPTPSQYILEGILSVLQEKQMSTGALAKQLGKSKKELKSILSGQSPLTVDDLSAIGGALKLEDSDLQKFMHLPDSIELSEPESQEMAGLQLSEGIEDPVGVETWNPNPVGTHARQVLRLGFALGCNLFFIANTKALQNSGIPEAVLKQYGEKLPIRLDSDFFHHYRPEYFDEGVEIRLSFDAVYTCFFPWHTFEQITFFVEDEAVESNEPTSSTTQKPTLRIID